MEEERGIRFAKNLPYVVGNVFKMLYEFPTALVISDDGQKILYENEKNLVYVDSDSGKTIRNLHLFTKFIGFVDLNKTNDKALAGSADNQAKIVDLKTGKCLHDLKGHQGFVFLGGFNPQSTIAATACQNMKIKIWDVESGKQNFEFAQHKQTPTYLSYNPDGDKLLTCSYENEALIWNANDGQIVCKLSKHTRGLEVAKFASSGYICATGSHDNKANVWDIRNPEQPLFTLEGHQDYIKELAFNKQQTQIVTGSNDNTGRIYNLQDGKFVGELSNFPGQVYAVSFNEAGNKIIGVSNNKTVQIFDNQGTCLQQITGEGNVYINKTGNTFVTMPKSIDSQAKVWREARVSKH
ncbi:unnamed protein product [Paramecium primaurelia]|uniref:Uncharacterized protein n=1 Tax=Paramecium primaurelia TaxID=5886 RepID=A0A8S1P7J8_PARPR|nr:unnamed protein product [Paramecium primaurelia]